MSNIDQLFKSIFFNANIYLHSEFCSPWNIAADNPNLSSFHVVAYGNCALSIKDMVKNANIHQLNAGDLIFFPRNIPHEMYNKGDKINTTLICGKLDFGGISNPILDALPEVLHIKANQMDKFPWFKSLFQQIINEAESGSQGSQIILDKLAEILFIYVVRYYIQCDKNSSASKQGLLSGMADTQLSKALIAMHRDLSQSWTVQSLADVAAMSRSAFSNKFHELVGSTPLQYLTQFRLNCAYHYLQSTTDSIIKVALNHGYQSEAAFSKVFKKHYGISPGKISKKTNST